MTADRVGPVSSPEQAAREQRDSKPTSPSLELNGGTSTVEGQNTKAKKPLSFYMSITMLALVALVVSWEATTLAVAIPVCSPKYWFKSFKFFFHFMGF